MTLNVPRLNEIDFKVVIVNTFKELKETMFKELKESTTMNQQIEIFNKEIQIIFFKKNQIEFSS